MTKDSDPHRAGTNAGSSVQDNEASADAGADSSMRERARRLILKRRRFFVASALMGLSATGCETKEPQVCLSVEMVPNPSATSGAAGSASSKPDAQDKPAPSSTSADGSSSADAANSANAAGSSSANVAGSNPDGSGSAEPPKPKPFKPSPRVCLKIYIPPDGDTGDQG